MNKNKYLPWIAMAGFVISFAVVLPASAQTPMGRPNMQGGRFGVRGGMPAITPVFSGPLRR